ncbi:hypothetical protein CU098_003514, partial [Rhizopus stolonifer]
FDPAPVINAGIDIKVAQLVDQDFKLEDTVTYVGLSGRNEVQTKKTTINNLSAVRTSETTPARWRAMNVEAYKVSDGSLSSQGGLFADDQAQVRAIWMNFSIENERRELSSIFGGISARLILPVLQKIKAGQSPMVRGMDAEFWSLQVCNARLVGVSDEWIQKIKHKATKEGRQPSVVYVLGVTDISTPSGQLLKAGDIVLAIDGQVLSSISDLSQFHEQDTLTITLLRDGIEQEMQVPTTQHDGKETTELVGWQGLLIQNTYRAAKEQVRKQVPEGVYVASCLFGSPAQACLRPGIWITHVGSSSVKTLNQFLQAVNNKTAYQAKPTQSINTSHQLLSLPTQEEMDENMAFQDDATHLQIKFVTADNLTQVKALKLDHHYWPTWHIKKNESSPLGWDMSFLS